MIYNMTPVLSTAIRQKGGPSRLIWAIKGKHVMWVFLHLVGKRRRCHKCQRFYAAIAYRLLCEYGALRALCQKGADTNLGMGPLLTIASRSGDIPLARALIKLGAGIHVLNFCGMGSLLSADWRNGTRMVKLLIENGGDVSLVNS